MSVSIEYLIGMRFDVLARLDDEILIGLKKSGCRSMGMGVESGSDRILNIIGKNISAKEMLTELKRLRKFEIIPTLSMMVGQFTETEEDVQASIDFVKEATTLNPLTNFAFTITTPFPGTELYKYILKNGLIKDDYDFYNKYFESENLWKPIVNLSKISDDKLIYYLDILNKEYQNTKKHVLGEKRSLKITKIEKLQGRIEHIRKRIPFSNVFSRFINYIEKKLDDKKLKIYLTSMK